MEVIHDALCLNPQQEKNARPLTIMGPSSDTITEEGVVGTMEEASVGKTLEKGRAQQTTHEGDNPRSPLDTSAI